MSVSQPPNKAEILERFSDLSLTLALVDAIHKRRTLDDNGLVGRLRYQFSNKDKRTRIMGAALTLLVRDTEVIACMPFAASQGLVVLRDLDEDTMDYLGEEQQDPAPQDPGLDSFPKSGPRVQFATFANPDREAPSAVKDKCIEVPLGNGLWNNLKDAPSGYVFSRAGFDEATLLNTSKARRDRRLVKIVEQWYA